MKPNLRSATLLKTRLATAASALFVAPVALAAPGDRLGSEIIVTTNTSSTSSGSPAIARNAAGEFVVVWSAFVSGGFNGIQGQRFAADGTPTGAAFPIVADPKASNPTVAMDAEGDFVVVWIEYAPTTLVNRAATKMGIYGRSFSAGGVPHGSEFKVSDSIGEPSVAIDDDGDFVVAWHPASALPPIAPFGGYGPGIPGIDGLNSVHARRFLADGTPKSRVVLVDERVGAIGAKIDSVSVAMDPVGNYALVWGRTLNRGSNVYAHRYTADGRSIAATFQVNTQTATGDQHSLPSVGIDRHGNLVVAWSYDSQDQRVQETRVKIFAADGTVRVLEFSASVPAGTLYNRPKLAVDPIGNFVIAAGGGFDPVSARLFGADGTPLSGVVTTLADATRRQAADHSVAIDATGSAVVTWDNLNSRGDTSGISAQRFAPP